jgi:hypothetical protein
VRIAGGELACVLAVLVLAGCGGGTLSKHAFQKDAESLQSLAAEGTLLAAQVAEGEGTHSFTSVHALYLERIASKLAKKLEAAKTDPSLDRKRSAAAALAASLDEKLTRLHESPTDRKLGERLASDFKQEADAAEKLAK